MRFVFFVLFFKVLCWVLMAGMKSVADPEERVPSNFFFSEKSFVDQSGRLPPDNSA